MLQVNLGGGREQWLRVPAEAEAEGTLYTALRRALGLTRARQRLAVGEPVLAPDGATLRPAVVSEAAAGCANLAGRRTVAWSSTGTGTGAAAPPATSTVAEGRLVRRDGFCSRLLEGCERASAAVHRGGRVSVWRAEIWCEGLFSVLFWALGFLEAEAKAAAATGRPVHLLIDWTDERILFHRSGSRALPNAWNSFFEQPGRAGSEEEAEAARLPDAAALEAALCGGGGGGGGGMACDVSVAYGEPFFSKMGSFRGADECAEPCEGGGGLRGGRLDEGSAEAGRLAVLRWVRLRPRLRRRVEAARDELGLGDGRGWLAVHVRRTDKLQQCASNGLDVARCSIDVAAHCSSLGCGGAFVCSDDARLKAALGRSLAAAGLRVAALSVELSAAGKPAHLDPALDARANAEDCLVESVLMGRHCTALLSTWSNVSVGAVFFSPTGYEHRMFGDAPPPRLPRRVGAGAGAGGAAAGVGGRARCGAVRHGGAGATAMGSTCWGSTGWRVRRGRRG